MNDTNKERAILDTAISLLYAEADAVREGVTNNGEPDWSNEPDAYAAFQQLSETAKALFDLAAKAPAAEPVAYIVRSVKRPSERGTLIHADKAGSYQRATLSLEPIYTAPPAPTEQWIGVTERLPEWVHRDDTPCHINGKEVPPTLTSKTVLVALDGGGVRTDKLTTIEGKSNGWWHTFGERVVAWQDTPAPPQGAANKDES